MEIFKEIKGYDGYLISNKGRVKTVSRLVKYTHAVTKENHYRRTNERLLKEHINGSGYKFYQLYKNGNSKNIPAHRLVAIAFIENPHNYTVVNHIDGNKLNNCAENLEWCTNEYNHEHATKNGLKASGSAVAGSKLTPRCVNAIRYFINLGFSHEELSKAFNVSRSAISLIAENKTWKQVALTGAEFNYKPI